MGNNITYENADDTERLSVCAQLEQLLIKNKDEYPKLYDKVVFLLDKHKRNDYIIDLLKKYANEKNNYIAQYILSTCYITGRCTNKNKSEALKYLLKSAHSGYNLAQYLLGQIYEGKSTYLSVPRDLNNAFQWTEKAISYNKAKLTLARYYGYGLGVDKNVIKAITYYLELKMDQNVCCNIREQADSELRKLLSQNGEHTINVFDEWSNQKKTIEQLQQRITQLQAVASVPSSTSSTSSSSASSSFYPTIPLPPTDAIGTSISVSQVPTEI